MTQPSDAVFQGHLVAMDANGSRLRGLAATAEQQGVPAGFLMVQAATLQSFAAEHAAKGLQPFDRVLLDVPCSGLGVLSKRADLRWRRRPADVAAAAALQVCAACMCVVMRVTRSQDGSGGAAEAAGRADGGRGDLAVNDCVMPRPGITLLKRADLR